MKDYQYGTRRARPGAGRKPGIPNRATADIKSLAQSHGPDAIARLVAIFQSAETPPAAHVAAIKELLDRGFGKAAQPISGSPDLPPIQINASELTDDQLAAIAATGGR
ncbi:hypothetical protein BUW96_13605 [Achromobacter insolitus]|nr:hypothetical protein BUW96_13605 [Achromobacter insolitus]